MAVFFQHVGEAGGGRDFPRTIGTVRDGLRHFHFEDIEPYLSHLERSEIDRLHSQTQAEAPSGFQIWGIPSGAKAVLSQFRVGDFLLLLEAAGPGGTFAYVGRAIARPSQPSFELSRHLWQDERYALIVFLRGGLSGFSWPSFCERLGYSAAWNPAGKTYRVQPERIHSSTYVNEEGLIRAMSGSDEPLSLTSISQDETLLDPAELDFADEEGRQLLREHLFRERSARLVLAFKRSLKEYSCQVCGFDFLKVYGDLGSKFIEAHHTKAVRDLNSDEVVTTRDLVAVCSNCHRMLHRRYPAMRWEDLKSLMLQQLE